MSLKEITLKADWSMIAAQGAINRLAVKLIQSSVLSPEAKEEVKTIYMQIAKELAEDM